MRFCLSALVAGCLLACTVGCSSSSQGTDDASVSEAQGSFSAGPPQASKNPQVTGVEQWVPAHVVTEDGTDYVVFLGYGPGASDADLKDPLKATYTIVWQNDGEDHVTVGWGDPNRRDPAPLSQDQLQAFADDMRAIGDAVTATSLTTSSLDGTLKPQTGLIGKTTDLLGPCGTAQVARAAAIAGTLLFATGVGLTCVYGFANACVGGAFLTYEFTKDTLGMNKGTREACKGYAIR